MQWCRKDYFIWKQLCSQCDGNVWHSSKQILWRREHSDFKIWFFFCMKLDPAMEHIASLSEFSARPFILSCTYIQDIHKEENNSGALFIKSLTLQEGSSFSDINLKGLSISKLKIFRGCLGFFVIFFSLLAIFFDYYSILPYFSSHKIWNNVDSEKLHKFYRISRIFCKFYKINLSVFL